MTQRFTLTILPDDVTVQGQEGDSLYTLLLVEGLIKGDQPETERFFLEKGSVSPAQHPEKEEEVFTSAQRTEGWLLASERLISGDAVLNRTPEQEPEATAPQPLVNGYGLVFDVGSVTVSVGLVDMRNMRIRLLTAGQNSQLQIASEPQDRMKWAKGRENGEAILRRLLLDDVQRLARKILHAEGVDLSQVKAICCTGHAMMLSLLAKGMNQQPGKVLRCTSKDLISLKGDVDIPVYLLPVAGKKLSAELVSCCLAADLWHKKDNPDITLLLSLGQEGYVAAAGQGRLIAAHVPSMPFEGYGIRWGMPSLTGAIIRVDIDDRVTLRTVRDARPKGITGAGLLSAVQSLHANGLIDSEGHFVMPQNLSPEIARHFHSGIDGREFILSFADKHMDHDITICQEDIIQLQMAKGAIGAACKAILSAMGASDMDVSAILLSESYHAHLDPNSLLTLNMIPGIPVEQITPLGNSAWQGACMSLSDQRQMELAEQIAGSLEYLDTTADLIYAEEFIKGMSF